MLSELIADERQQAELSHLEQLMDLETLAQYLNPDQKELVEHLLAWGTVEEIAGAMSRSRNAVYLLRRRTYTAIQALAKQ